MCFSTSVIFAEACCDTRFCYIADMSPSGLTSANDMHNFISRDNDRTGHQGLKDTKTLGSAYDRYLQSAGVTYLPIYIMCVPACFLCLLKA